MPQQARCEADVVYGHAGRDLLCDLHFPDPAERNGYATLVLHPGGWRRGSRADISAVAAGMAERGYLAVNVGYRLVDESPWPAQIHDTKTAIRWLRANAARLEVNPEKILIVGASAGAHLGLLAAGTANSPVFFEQSNHAGVDEQVAALAVIYPPTRFDTLSLASIGLTAAEGVIASPIEYVTPSFPPTIFLHGAADKWVPPSLSLQMFEALTASGVWTDLRLFGRLSHGFVNLMPGMIKPLIDDVTDFFDRAVLRRAEFDQNVEAANRFLAEAVAAAGVA